MKIRNISAFFAAVVIFLFFGVPFSLAQVFEEPLHIPGTAEGTGTHFEITDSEYLNVSLDSSAVVAARIESAPEMIVIRIEASGESDSANLAISGLSPNTTYHKYEDNYHNYAPFTTDGNGAFSFDQNVSQNHIIFIQPRKSTKFIKDDANGGDCESIGDWNASDKTCKLDEDISETIEVDSDNITLDGNGRTITGSNTGSGVYVVGDGVTIKNITVTGFYYGIQFYYSTGGKVTSSVLENNRFGIHLNHSQNITVSDNTIKSNITYGLGVYNSGSNIVSDNVIGPGNAYGISQEYTGNYNIYENNNVSNNSNTGIRTYWGSYITLRDNIVRSNSYDGVVISAGSHIILSGNIMAGNGFGGWNGKSNFSIGGGDMSTNDIDESNTVEGKPIYYLKGEANKIYDSSFNIGSFYCINCDRITVKDLTLSEHAAKICFWHTNNSSVENVTSPDKIIAVNLSYSSNNTFSKNTFDYISLQYQSNGNRIYNNNIMHKGIPAYVYNSTGNLFNLDLPTGGNFWKKNEANCIDADNNGICDDPYIFIDGSGGRDDYPWAKEFDQNTASCCSSVMFLPGHQSSRLYKKHSYDEDQLWEPTNRNEDVRDLYLSSQDGSSVDPNIYTRDIIGEVYGIGGNIYKSYIGSMDKLVEEDIINEWRPVPYDWRMPLEKIADDGVELENGAHMDIIEEVKNMAADSKTGKVTLIGHSNGGLLAKVLIDQLKDSGEEKLIDRLIMVGTPQLGTPKALAGLLHGDEINLLHGLILDKKTGRGFAENMVSAYNLMPSKKYFDTVQSPIVEFDSDVKNIYDFRSLYGDNIDNWEEFKKFLLGDNGKRSEPEEGDTDSPNVLKEALLAKADATHDSLDLWQASQNTEVIQIAGWGLDTIRGIEYDDCDVPFCPDKLSNLDRSLLLTEDGDETVVVPSAVEIEGNAEKYYVNINEYNKELILNLRRNRNHASILEIKPLQDFIKSIIQNNKVLTDHISTEKPEVKDEDKRLRFRLHSPVSIDLYDEDGNHTGLIENLDPASDLQFYEEQIPNSYYWEFGEKKYAGSASATNIVLTGEDLGTFTFEVDEVAGDEVAKTTTFSNVPVMKDMKATLFISDTVGEMKIDADNDGKEDAVIQAGEEMKKEDLLGILEKIIGSLDINKAVKNSLVQKISIAKKQMEKKHLIAANALLESAKWEIRLFSREKTSKKLRISEEVAGKLIGIIERIQAME